MNNKMAAILGMDEVPEEVTAKEVVVVEPHEIVKVDNSDLPAMHDIDRKQLQAEKQLEEVIEFSLGYQRSLFEQVETVEPKYRSRYVEVANGTMGLALDAIKTKIKTQENRRKQRLDEAEFQRPGGKGGNGETNNNFFVGSREDLIKAMRDAGEDE